MTRLAVVLLAAAALAPAAAAHPGDWWWASWRAEAALGSDAHCMGFGPSQRTIYFRHFHCVVGDRSVVLHVTGRSSFVTTPWAAANDSQAKAHVRAAIPAVEAYNAEHGTYAGMTAARLRGYDSGLRAIVVVSASRTTYCLKSTVGGSSWYKHGPAGDITKTPCR